MRNVSSELTEKVGHTALLGLATPISGIALPANDSSSVIAIVTTRLGTITADPSPGAIVRGSGSTTLWISGSPAQIDAKLATLTYLGTSVGSDQLSVLTLDSDGTLTTAARTTMAVLPLAGRPDPASSPVYYDHGTMTLDSRTLDGPDLSLREPANSQNATTLVLINSMIGASSHLVIRNDNTVGNPMPRLAIGGRVELGGTTTLAGNGTAVSLAQGATLLNEGSMAIDAHLTRFTGAGTFVNDGVVLVTGDGTATAPVAINTSLSGTGTISLANGASVRIGASVGVGETILLGNGNNTLYLDQPEDFHGQIAGFSAGDTLVFAGASVTDALFTRSAESGNVSLSLFDGTLLTAIIRFSAPQAGMTLQFGADAAGNPAAWLAVTPPSPSPRSSVEVFRFFDTTHGTQLLTQAPAERDAIVESRPDLRFEGVGLHALDPAQPGPGATPIFRFFDTGNGTHFMTASTAERDDLLASRPDLVFEPGSTMFQHATAQAGDTAVYRFFDRSNGAHLFTADAGERATIIATRPDMAFEGIAFYAPSA